MATVVLSNLRKLASPEARQREEERSARTAAILVRRTLQLTTEPLIAIYLLSGSREITTAGACNCTVTAT